MGPAQSGFLNQFPSAGEEMGDMGSFHSHCGILDQLETFQRDAGD